MNVLNIIFAYFIFMAVIQVHEKLLCTNDFFPKIYLTVLFACREVFTDLTQNSHLQN